MYRFDVILSHRLQMKRHFSCLSVPPFSIIQKAAWRHTVRNLLTCTAPLLWPAIYMKNTDAKVPPHLQPSFWAFWLDRVSLPPAVSLDSWLCIKVQRKCHVRIPKCTDLPARVGFFHFIYTLACSNCKQHGSPQTCGKMNAPLNLLCFLRICGNPL